MTGRRLKLIAAQAVLVGALMIVVSLTLLRPEDGNPLFDIVAPGPAEVSVGKANSWWAHRDPAENRRPDRPDSPVAPGRARPPLGLVPAPQATPQDPPAPGDDGEDPTDAQYADSLSRLTQQVR